MAKSKTNRYTEDDVDVLDSIEAIRARPTMYNGSVDSDGLFHILKEVADNAVDEFLAERNSRVYIQIDGSVCMVGDDGQGIPTGIHRKTKRPTIETIFSVSHSGGKFSDKAYKTSVGTHGVGVTVTNALSASLEAWSAFSGKWQSISFAKGKVVSALSAAKPPKFEAGMKPSGTIVRFEPDMTIFEKKSKLNTSAVEHWAQMTAFINSGLQVELYDTKTKKHQVWKYENGLDDLTDLLAKEHGSTDEFARFAFNDDTMAVRVAWFNGGKGSVGRYYTNSSFNRLGGKHVELLWDAMYSALEDVVASSAFKHLKLKELPFEAEDLKLYSVAIFNVKLNQPKFSSQTKEKLNDSRVKDLHDPLEKQFIKFFSNKKNASVVETLVAAAELAHEMRTKKTVDKTLEKKLRDQNKAGTLLPGKLTAAPRCKPEEREIFLVEGDSAGGTAIPARYSVHYQEILKLKGKPLNAARASVERYSANAEVFSILAALGYNPSADDPYEKLRCRNKLIFLTDPDVDGYHITILLLALISVVLPDLFTKGYVYIVKSPEYMATVKGKRYYGQTKKELTKALPKGSKAEFQHIKGWGEISAAVLREVAFDPKTRTLIKITIEDLAEAREFINLMADEGIETRKDLLGVNDNA